MITTVKEDLTAVHSVDIFQLNIEYDHVSIIYRSKINTKPYIRRSIFRFTIAVI